MTQVMVLLIVSLMSYLVNKLATKNVTHFDRLLANFHLSYR